jgi:hypothetical protein
VFAGSHFSLSCGGIHGDAGGKTDALRGRSSIGSNVKRFDCAIHSNWLMDSIRRSGMNQVMATTTYSAIAIHGRTKANGIARA